MLVQYVRNNLEEIKGKVLFFKTKYRFWGLGGSAQEAETLEAFPDFRKQVF